MRLQRDESGQSMIEFALIAPLLVLLLAGVVYLGGLVTIQEKLAVDARHVARRAALHSQEKALGDARGKRPASIQNVRSQALGEAAAGSRGRSLAPPGWGGLGVKSHGDAYTAIYQARAPNGAYQMGIGVVFHGATVNKDLKDLAPLGRFAGVLVPRVGATAVTATELSPEELLALNPWIRKIVQEGD